MIVITFLSLMLAVGFSMCLFQTGNVFGVIRAHIVLSVTDNNRQPIAANTFLTNDMNETLSWLNKDGWTLLKEEDQSYLLERDGKYRNVVFIKHTITDYDLIMIGDAYDDISERKKQID